MDKLKKTFDIKMFKVLQNTAITNDCLIDNNKKIIENEDKAEFIKDLKAFKDKHMEGNLANAETASTKNLVSRRRYVKDVIFEHVTTVVHTLVVAFLAIVAYLFDTHEVHISTWHGLLLTIGFSLLLTEGVLVMNRQNVFTKELSQATRVNVHRFMLVFALLLCVAGFVLAIRTVEGSSSGHFGTWHGKFGLATFVCVVVAFLNGVLAMNNVGLKKYIKPNLNKLFHVVTGIATVVLGGVTVFFAIYLSHGSSQSHDDDDDGTHEHAQRHSGHSHVHLFTNDSMKVLSYVILLLTVLWTLVHPLLTVFNAI